MTYLLDVNLLIALLDADHIHHVIARWWFEALVEPWATCAITETGVVRIMSSHKYPQGMETPADAIKALRQLCTLGQHVFWAETVSIRDQGSFHLEKMKHSGQVTDIYLLALAVSYQGKLATLDKRLSIAPVPAGSEALFLLTG